MRGIIDKLSRGDSFVIVLSIGFLSLFAFSLSLTNHSKSRPGNKNHPIIAQDNASADNKDVLSHTSEASQIFISGNKNGYSSGGVIPLTSLEEPVVTIGGYNISGEAKVDIYEADEEALLSYLIHDKDGVQLKKEQDVSRFKFLTTLDYNFAKSGQSDSKLLLPIGKNGIWFLRVKAKSIQVDSFIIRSDLGVLVKEGDNQLIFWGQKFSSGRSITDGNLILLNLQDESREIGSTDFNNEGIAIATLTEDADIAIARSGGDFAVIPINLRNLNINYSYDRFLPKSKLFNYFTFTDRPLYRPGDTIFFKSIIRDDDDARYAIPGGAALVRIFQGGEKDPIYEKNHPISDQGTIKGDFKLPEDASTGYYSLRVNIDSPSSTSNYGYYGDGSSSISFNVERFRKPEYSIDIEAPDNVIIAGDKSSFKIKGAYFSGHPLANKSVKYNIITSDYYEYQYITDRARILSDDYRYGYWYGKKLIENSVVLNKDGETSVEFLAQQERGGGKSKVYTIEAQFEDESGNPVFARKNVLVMSGEYGIFRKRGSYSAKIGSEISLPLVLVANRDNSVSNIPLTASIRRKEWISYQEKNKKHLSYREVNEELPDQSVTTDSQGNAVLRLTPKKTGSHIFKVEGKDKRGNMISKDFSIWVYKEGVPYYGNQYTNELTIKADQDEYKPIDTARLTISSTIPDRDVFLSLERAHVNRYLVVRLNGNTGVVDLPLVGTDIPNIFAQALSFSTEGLDTSEDNLIVSTESKELNIDIVPNQDKYGPGDTVILNISTTDKSGNPVSADTAIWAVDKAIFELIPSNLRKIFETFWRERYNRTTEAHSLEGILAVTAEMGGGCFAEGTEVLMADGSLKAIEKIKPGEKILTRKGENDKKPVEAKVISAHSLTVDGYLIINGDLKVTPVHRLWVNNEWKTAGNIQVGDNLTNTNGESVFIESIEWQAGKYKVYNLEIEKYNTYFAGGVWVHNQKGGGGGRTIFKDTAYWNPSVRTDSNGRAKITFKLPDNLTTWVISAVGSTTDTKVGQVKKDIIVTQDVIVRPVLPNIMRVGDKLSISAMVHNFTTEDHKFDVDLLFDSGRVKSATHSGIQIRSKETEQLFWEIDPVAENEQAKLIFSASSKSNNNAVDKIVSTIPVREFGFWERSAETGDGAKVFTVNLAPDSDKDRSKVTLSLASSLLGTLPTAMDYLVNYPYGCVEQTTSRFVPAVIAKSNPDLFSDSIADKDIDDIIQAGLKRLVKLQNNDGGWSWWSSEDSNPFITAYVVEYILEAQQTGMKIDKNMLARARNYLERDTVYDPAIKTNRKIDPDDRVAKEYALSLFESSDKKILISASKDATVDIIALAVMANARNGFTNPLRNGMSKLTSMGIEQGDGMFWEGGSKEKFGSKDASTSLAVRAILLGGGNRNMAAKGIRYLTRNRQSNYWSNTFATSQVIRATVDLANTGQELNPNYTYSVLLDGEKIAEGVVNNSRQIIKAIDIPITNKKLNTSSITLQKNGEGQLYSTLVIEEFRTDRLAKAKSNNLSISRKYTSHRGPNANLAVGDAVTINLTVSGLKAGERYAVINDELPAGMIPINQVFKNEQYGQQRTYYYTGVSNREVTENGMVLSINRVGGTSTYTYKARIVSEGTFSVPPATASLMYAPEIDARSEAETIEISQNGIMFAEPELEVPIEISDKKWLFGFRGLNVVFSIIALLIVLIWTLVNKKTYKEDVRNVYNKFVNKWKKRNSS